eukprot:TRINITY_DN8250_c0_g1_i8.p1 TRINITY_DN8250_c0_g1~~TRINITY_DN8250_c0_g1_i8.p1  ORF type:complete len:654 (+),score=154.63 TRINITY_DN8250_c0_g1_i8:86-1963(+)
MCIRDRFKRPEVDRSVQETIQEIYQRLQKEQQDKNEEFSTFPILKYQKMKGLYHSYIKLNFNDEKASFHNNMLRHTFNVYDVNMFVSNFALLAILESSELGVLNPDKTAFTEAVKAIVTFKDKNHADGVPIYTFWPQQHINGTWKDVPKNIANMVNMFPDIPAFLVPILRERGFEFMTRIKDMDKAFRIPPDTDDSSVNLALGEALKARKNDFPEAWAVWQQVNKDYKGYFNLVKKYAYRPFLSLQSNVPDYISQSAEYLDPRAYFYLHDFLTQQHKAAQSAGKTPSLILATTWLLDKADEKRLDPQVAMPMGVNNVDLTVNANTLFGLTQFLLGNEKKVADEIFSDPDIRQMYGDMTNLLVYAIQNDIPFKRPDIALVYYPSTYDFYWFAARIVFALEKVEGQLPYPELTRTRSVLGEALRSVASKQLISRAKKSGNQVYWEEFLGNYGGQNKGEDRLFSTALALNALIDIWSVKKQNTRKWRDDAPENAKQSIRQGLAYLKENILRKGASLDNVFFSGSVKSIESLPFWYPGTAAQTKEGKILDPTKAAYEEIKAGIWYYAKGYINDQEYQSMKKKKYFTKDVPLEFKGFNTGIPFPFWSSPAITYSMSMLAFAKFINIEAWK